MTSGKDINTTVTSAARDGRISCVRAFELSAETGYKPEQLGAAMDENKIKITLCQLGLFGHGGNKAVKPAETVDKKIEDLIKSRLNDGKISCDAVWCIADEMKMKKFDIACACEKMKIRINRCRLGAF